MSSGSGGGAAFSRTWFRTFLHTIPAAKTDHEVAFLRRVLPLADHARVLDMCCGAGRHAVRLARAGYRVTGADRDAEVLAAAERHAPENPRYVSADLRRPLELGGPFDAVLVLWQSFGQFSARENRRIVRDLASLLTPRGRLVLDLYHRDFFEAHQGASQHGRADGVTEEKRMRGRRLAVRLSYPDGARDRFEWELFTPDEIVEVGRRAGLRRVLVCTGYDESLAASGESPRFQVVMERDGS